LSDAPPPDAAVSSTSSSPPRRWYRRIGPGLVTACVVIGPGSLLTSSKVGATHGYAMSWVVLVAVGCMMVYTTLGAKLGVVAAASPADLVTRHAGRWLAAVIGIAIFFVAATFQFANNLGLDAAAKVYVDDKSARIGIVVGFNVLSLAFLYGFRNLYGAIEKLMMAFVASMLLAFVANLLFSAPHPVALVKGFVPTRGTFGVEVLGLVATTFSPAAAYYQAYLVRQKGWGRANLRDGLFDARVAAVVMGVITLMLVWTAGTVLHGRMTAAELAEADGATIARQLAPLFGPAGVALFCIGLFCAAYSSFLVNSMIGGFVLADGLGLGEAPERAVPKLLTAVALLIGMGLAIGIIQTDARPVNVIIAAQAVTVVVAPLMAGVLLWLTNSRTVMGEQRNGPVLNLFAVAGFVILLAMAASTAQGVYGKLFPSPPATAVTSSP
jgi:manganese transport protein